MRCETDLLFPIGDAVLWEPNYAHRILQPNHVNLSTPRNEECPTNHFSCALINDAGSNYLGNTHSHISNSRTQTHLFGWQRFYRVHGPRAMTACRFNH